MNKVIDRLYDRLRAAGLEDREISLAILTSISLIPAALIAALVGGCFALLAASQSTAVPQPVPESNRASARSEPSIVQTVSGMDLTESDQIEHPWLVVDKPTSDSRTAKIAFDVNEETLGVVVPGSVDCRISRDPIVSRSLKIVPMFEVLSQRAGFPDGWAAIDKHRLEFSLNGLKNGGQYRVVVTIEFPPGLSGMEKSDLLNNARDEGLIRIVASRPGRYAEVMTAQLD